MKNKKTSKIIGNGFAVLQGLFDDVMDFGFSKLKEVNKKEESLKEAKTWTDKVRVGVKNTAGFVGEVGESFYDKYEEIKKRKN